MAFGLTTTSSSYTVDTGGGLVFSILRQGTSSTVHSGDLTSFKLNGNEFAAPFASPDSIPSSNQSLQAAAARAATQEAVKLHQFTDPPPKLTLMTRKVRHAENP